MDGFHFSYANFRYLVFQLDGQYYLLDRQPNHLIAYLFMPLTWFFYQRVYPLTNEDYLNIRQKNDVMKQFVIPSALGVGASVFVGNWLRIHHVSKYFETDFSVMFKIILLLLAMAISSMLAWLVYNSRKRSIASLTHVNLTQPLYYKLRPSRISSKMIGTYMAYLLVIVGMASMSLVAFICSGNLVFLLITILMVFLHFMAVNLAYSTDIGYSYKVVDRLETTDKNRMLH
ncbi:hypothetical protein BU202_01990 [Streptococcus cuniculi]|uniref:DUF443 family protein n=2 Tax=Streptococcus cuniculi TaxID=1432788 RepID=A0A1Q8E9E7_9STRE|nr:hypothetical protein BU202_01990 [Streptococcus cuniculi]